MHCHRQFKTVAGDIAYGKDGEWRDTRQYLTQFQNIEPNNLEQFKSGDKQPILWPPERLHYWPKHRPHRRGPPTG